MMAPVKTSRARHRALAVMAVNLPLKRKYIAMWCGEKYIAVYAAIEEMEALGWIEHIGARQAHVYSITRAGRVQLGRLNSIQRRRRK